MGGYVPNTKEQRQDMLKAIGLSSMEDLFVDIPQEVRLKGELEIPQGKSELEVKREMEDLAGKNRVFRTIFRGAGAYRHYIPAAVTSIISKENFLTAYTPYQAEVSQGILQSIFEYQTMICDLTGMDASNASVYDGASAAAEGVAMCRERKRAKALISGATSPYVIQTIQTYCHGNGMEMEVIPEKDGKTDWEKLKARLDSGTACVYIQHPNFYGNLEDAKEIGELTHEAGAKFVMGVNPISLGMLKTPAEYGADVAVGEGQPLGLPLAFGGPYIGFMACTDKMMRKLPGRIVGQTKDRNGKTGYVLTLQAREQHIRREKASSNICSNQALCALAVTVYLSSMGNEGLREAALQSASKAHYLSKELETIGYHTENQGTFFHEFVTTSKVSAKETLDALEAHGILGGYPLDEHRILWCCTEVNTKEEMDDVIRILKEVQSC
ncbi:aminomethyl-transferring glycine dehydrogenase subunit GcvPA [Sellimonas intestinalis]|uniref:aminomethyl-transferring glycine dehydrogenase subunit GcvPA n=1 Tax=Sellimonas intestinalis TaxID=1653434 RepID=UPI0015EB284A|nr:aminomethyl-transferring glycine dehydrogenase subunit GcvPA [Sellimonas intestinalis]MBA2213367.1 aminomethyl-transferring glycine dehydrogenase subunit GcvPA [Sellimonas intestinalis]